MSRIARRSARFMRSRSGRCDRSTGRESRKVWTRRVVLSAGSAFWTRGGRVHDATVVVVDGHQLGSLLSRRRDRSTGRDAREDRTRSAVFDWICMQDPCRLGWLPT